MIFPTSPGGICIPFPGGENSRWWIEAKGLDSREYGSPERLGFPESNKKMLKLFCTRVVGVVVCKVTLDFSPCTRLLLFFFFGYVFFSQSPACITNIFVMNSPNHSNESESNRSRPSVLQKEIPAIFAHLPGFSSHKMNEHLLSPAFTRCQVPKFARPWLL